jgi:hypothetical protein
VCHLLSALHHLQGTDGEARAWFDEHTSLPEQLYETHHVYIVTHLSAPAGH